MKKIESIDTFDSLMRVLRRYFGLNGTLDLTPEQKQQAQQIYSQYLAPFEKYLRYT
jgi:hypothetical protein